MGGGRLEFLGRVWKAYGIVGKMVPMCVPACLKSDFQRAHGFQGVEDP